MNTGPTLVLEVVSQKTGRSSVFMKLNDLFPECSFLIEGADQLHPLFCLVNDVCPRNANCMEKLAKRVKYVFDTFEKADLLMLYFKHPDMPGSQRAGIFWRDNTTPPRYTVLNRSMWIRMKEIGAVYEWNLPENLFMVT